MTISIFLEPNIENFTGKFNKQSKLGFGAPTQRISSGNSTSKASWGSGPQHREFHREIQQAKQVGVRGPNTENFIGKFNKQSKLGFGAPTQRISSGNSTSKASWGSGFWTCGNEFNLNFDMCTQLIK